MWKEDSHSLTIDTTYAYSKDGETGNYTLAQWALATTH
jgi:hypothetical protein